ncbi:MAG: lamin tail domain-containing protein [Planctomycetota bacterium]|nr:lamin tail domain-containing protein [Planctomycetota bacterium]
MTLHSNSLNHCTAPARFLAAFLLCALPCSAGNLAPDRSDPGASPRARLGILTQDSGAITLLLCGTQPSQVLRLYGRLDDPRVQVEAPWETLALVPTDGTGQARLSLPKAAFLGWTLRVRGVGVSNTSLDLPITQQVWTPPGVLGGDLPDRERPRGSGEIIVTEIMKDPLQASDSQGEWFEVFNTTNGAIDIEGWILADQGSDMTLLDNAGFGIVVPPRGYLVLGREIDPNFNGGVPVDAVWSSFVLANGADEVLLARPNGAQVDLVAYGLVSEGWVDPVGASLQLQTHRLSANWNDSAEHWCEAPSPWGAGDKGSPGVLNPLCP